MILADKLMDLRKKSGWSQEDLAEKLEVSRQSISKWESAQSMPDMNRILRMADLFGVTTDYLLKDEMEPERLPGERIAGPDPDVSLRQVSMEEAQDFLKYRTISARRISLGVMMCILSPILLFLFGGIREQWFAGAETPLLPSSLSGAAMLVLCISGLALIAFSMRQSDKGLRSIGGMIGGEVLLIAGLTVFILRLFTDGWRPSEAQAGGLGLLFLFLLIGGAVALFVTTGLRGSRFEALEEELIETEYGVEGMVRDRREKFRKTFHSQLTTGIVLCVLALIPLFVVLILFGEGDSEPWRQIPHIISLALLFALAAGGVLLIVHSSILWGGYQILLEAGDYNRMRKRFAKRNEALSIAYWSFASAVYFAWSFLSEDWNRTWIVWPIAGVCYPVVCEIAGALRKRGAANKE